MAPRERILVLVAWPYANGPLHLGHVAGSLLPPDIFARFHRMKGNEVLMVSGSDMHGTPITVRSEKLGIPPEEFARKNHELHKEDLRNLRIQFDLFTSTATENHREVVHDVFRTLERLGYLYRGVMTAPFDPQARRFLLDRYVEGTCPYCGDPKARGDQCDSCGKILEPTELVEPRSVLTGAVPEWKKTEHYFFKLSAFEGRLKEWVATRSWWRGNVRHFTQRWLEEGLKDRPVTRDLEYGVPVPAEGFESKRIYVWFEAVIGYLSATIEWSKMRGDPDLWKRFWLDPSTRTYYFLGKDNIPFHSIIWPSILMGYSEGQGVNYNLPYDIPANEYMTFEGAKLSKSKGHVIEVREVASRFQSDALRYYLSVNMPEGRDANWSWEDFLSKVNDELVGTYGNLVQRVLVLVERVGGTVPPPGTPTEKERALLGECRRVFESVTRHLEVCEFKKAIREIMGLAQEGNRYIDSTQPWALLENDPERARTVLHHLLRLLRALAVLTAPFLPDSAEVLWKATGGRGPVTMARWEEGLSDLPVGEKIERPPPLFRKIEPQEVPLLPMNPPTSLARIEDFERIDLRVGIVRSVEPHPNADKLWVLKVEVGGRERQVLAGLKGAVPKERLLGKKVVVVTNLEPRRIRGLESEGMILAAEGEGRIGILTVDDDVPSGSKVR